MRFHSFIHSRHDIGHPQRRPFPTQAIPNAGHSQRRPFPTQAILPSAGKLPHGCLGPLVGLAGDFGLAGKMLEHPTNCDPSFLGQMVDVQILN
jgi:hypothetical protein